MPDIDLSYHRSSVRLAVVVPASTAFKQQGQALKGGTSCDDQKNVNQHANAIP
jgi:hypothetical protein